VTSENRTARLTILIDPRKKAVFERLCAEEDAVPSQVVRRLLRRYIEERLGKPWTPEENPQGAGIGAVPPSSGRRSRRASRSR
jgi:Ribbon-helix-helix protein